jgi:hypothetical protein
VRELSKRRAYGYNFLTNRVVSSWNNLSKSAIMAESVNGFKARIDKEVFAMAKRNDCNGPTRAKRRNALVKSFLSCSFQLLLLLLLLPPLLLTGGT